MSTGVTTLDLLDHLEKSPGFDFFSAGESAEKIKPWKLVATTNGEELASWYREAIIARTLAELETTDPQRHAGLIEGKKANERRGELLCSRELDFDAVLKKIEEEIPNANKKIAAWDAFRQETECSFRADGYPIDTGWAKRGAALIYYALFKNEGNNAYVSVVHDRHDDHKVKPASVGTIRLTPTGLSEAEILDAARWGWSEHLTRRMKFSPIVKPEHVAAMHDADRLRALFKAHADEATMPVGRPLRSVFEFFPAFQRAYRGRAGYRQALHDVIGLNSNAAYCDDQGVVASDWGGWRSGAAIGEQHFIHTGHLTNMYKEMNNQDRADFAAALQDFIEKDAPALMKAANPNSRFASNIDGELALLQILVEYGPGERMEASHLQRFIGMQEQMAAHLFPDDPKKQAVACRAGALIRPLVF